MEDANVRPFTRGQTKAEKHFNFTIKSTYFVKSIRGCNLTIIQLNCAANYQQLPRQIREPTIRPGTFISNLTDSK